MATYSIWDYDLEQWESHGQQFPRSGMAASVRKDPATILPNCPADLQGPPIYGDVPEPNEFGFTAPAPVIGYRHWGWFEEVSVVEGLGADQKHGAPVWGSPDFATGTVTKTTPAVNMTSGEIAAALDARRDAGIAAAQVRRREVEIGGIAWTRTSDSAVFGIATDIESQGKLTAARAAAVAGLRASGAKWKCQNAATGATVFEAFSDADMISIANAALAHVQAAYDREAALVAATTAAETTAALALVDPQAGTIDGAGGWPT
jgi:hypothetical protein